MGPELGEGALCLESGRSSEGASSPGRGWQDGKRTGRRFFLFRENANL